MYTIMQLTTTIKDGNIAYHVGDDRENVNRNRENLALKYQFNINDLRHMNQVHGNNVEVVDFESKRLIDNCDALVTNTKKLPIMVMVADCIPIFLCDDTLGVIAVVHAGRNSTFQCIVQKTVQKMVDEFGVNAKNISALLGPSIQKCCYEVSPELACIVTSSFGKEFVDGRLIDLQGINKKQLLECGVHQITVSDICTKCSKKPYFSYRNDKNCGRFSIIAMIE